MIAAVVAVIVPVVLGSLDRTAVGWRVGMLLPVIGLAALWLVFRRDALPAAPVGTVGKRRLPGRLPGDYWPVAVLVAVGVGVEFSLVFYGAILLDDDRGLTTAAAATAMSVFFVGILAGRIAGAGISRRPGRIRAMLATALATTTVGFTMFWLSSAPAAAIAGLFVTGLGVANLYPLCLAHRGCPRRDRPTWRRRVPRCWSGSPSWLRRSRWAPSPIRWASTAPSPSSCS